MAWSLFSQSAVSPKSWAVSVLQAGGWPQTNGNIQSLIAWALLEGGGGQYNPLNTTQGAGSNFNSVGVKNFASWNQGVAATVNTINNGHYPNVVADLQTGTGIGPTPNLGTWSGGGYTSLAGTWNSASKYMAGATAALPGGAAEGGLPPGSAAAAAGGGGASGWLQSVADGLAAVFGLPASVVANIAGAPDALSGSIVAGLAPLVKAGQAIDWFLQPGHWVRIIAGAAGIPLVLAGIWNLSHTGRPASKLSEAGVSVPVSTGSFASLPFGIAEVGVGAVLLFVAFHNLPSDVNSLPAMLGWLQGKAIADLKPQPAASGQTTG